MVYNDVSTGTLIILPRRPLDTPAEPQHLIPTRRQLVERGLIEEEDFDRWLCAMRFGDLGREPATVGAADGRTGGGTTG